MARLYAAGGDAVSVVEDGSVDRGLRERGARCLAVDPEDPDTLNTGSIEDNPAADGDATVRNPSGDNIGRAAEGDEGSDSRF